MTKDEALRMAIEWIDCLSMRYHYDDSYARSLDLEKLQPLKRALFEAQEPIAVVGVNPSGQIIITNPNGTFFDVSKHIGAKIYISPPKSLDKASLLEIIYKNTNSDNEGNWMRTRPLLDLIEKAPSREWVGLSDEEITGVWNSLTDTQFYFEFARAIEAKLREKNG